MIIAIYGRKSIFSDKSDSIETQINLAKDYANTHYPNATIETYIDEGFTGANTERPGFVNLMNDIKNNRIKALICYKIDRISRNVLDFSKTFNELQEHNVEFISIKEQIDTSTPLGRAMMYICSVFAQMERETIAERVTDNMIALAKDGKWTGGIAPLGYKIEKREINGKTHSILVPNQEELGFVNMLFDTFINSSSLNAVETYFKNNNIRTLNDKFMSGGQIHRILSTPYYVSNTEKIYDYFSEKGCKMVCERNDFDGKHGVMIYGRTKGGKKTKHSTNTPESWIVSSGLHQPIMSDEKWLSVQSRFGQNIINKTRKHQIGILKGVMYCKCGVQMRTKYKHDKQYDTTYEHYFCNKRIRQGVEYCDTAMIQIDSIDTSLLQFFTQIKFDKNLLLQYCNNYDTKTDVRNEKQIEKDIASNFKKIDNLTTALQDSLQSPASKYIIKEIENLDKIITSLNYELREVRLIEQTNYDKKLSLDVVYEQICDYIENFETLNYEEKNNKLKQIIKSCVWDGKELSISF